VQHRSERQNLKGIRKGRLEAYEAVISQNYASIYRFVLYLTGDSTLAEELTQETFASAWAGIDRFKGKASFGTWLHQIAYRKFIDSKRRIHRNNAFMAKLRQETCDTSETFDPFHRLTADEHTRLLYEAIYKLDSSERAAIVLHYIQGLSFREMAEVLDKPAGTVKWYTSRALKLLKAHLNGRVGP